MKISVVIPNYNGEENLNKILSELETISNILEIIVVDDASSDNSVGIIKKNFPNVKLIERLENRGFSSSVNDGVKAVHGQLVLLLNTDVIPEINFLDSLTHHFEDPDVFAVGCLQKSYEHNKIIFRGGGIGNFSKGLLIHQRGEVGKQNTLWVSAGAGLFRKDIWQKIGGLDSIYNPFYWEDIDISYRALKAGYKLVFESQSAVWHYHEKGSIKNRYTQNKIKEISYRNQILFIWLNISDKEYLLRHLLYLPYLFFKSLIYFDFSFVIGCISALLKLPKVLILRKKRKKLWNISDREILSHFKS